MHLARRDLDDASFFAVYIDVVADCESTINEYRQTFLEILITNLVEPSPSDDIELDRLVARFRFAVDRNCELCNRFTTVVDVMDFRVTRKIADDGDVIEVSHVVSSHRWRSLVVLISVLRGL